MDGQILYAGVGLTLWAWYACMVEPGTTVYMYVCYRHTLCACGSSARQLPVAGARLSTLCLAIALAQLSARCAARCPSQSVRPLLVLP